MFKNFRKCLAVSVIGAAGLAGNVHAQYSGLVIFGDSLSDTGNVLSLTTAFAPPPFPNFAGAPGRFSNGPAWTETLAAGLGFTNSAKPSNLLFNGTAVVPIGVTGGQNFAFGGARTGLGGAAGATTGLIGQLTAWNGSAFSTSLTRAADPNALYVVLAGANDLRDARTANPGASPSDAFARAAAAATTAQNVSNSLGLLAQAGARHFLISNLPDLGRTPEAAALGSVSASSDVTLRFNAALAADAAILDAAFFASHGGVDLDIRTVDFHGLVESVVDDALNHAGAHYGITNITVPCILPFSLGPTIYFSPGATDINCSVSAFSDNLHPSGAIHSLLGQAALTTAVPEPSSLAMFVFGVLMLAGWRRRSLATV